MLHNKNLAIFWMTAFWKHLRNMKCCATSFNMKKEIAKHLWFGNFQCTWEKMSLLLRVVYRISSLTFWFGQNINSTYAFQNVWLILNTSNVKQVFVKTIYRSVLAHITICGGLFWKIDFKSQCPHKSCLCELATNFAHFHTGGLQKQLEANICGLLFLRVTERR